jgi:hypothetical protein
MVWDFARAVDILRGNVSSAWWLHLQNAGYCLCSAAVLIRSALLLVCVLLVSCRVYDD